jgi:hypothetical protein
VANKIKFLIVGNAKNSNTSTENMIKNFFMFKTANDPAFKRRGDYDLVEVAKLIPGNQVPLHPVRVRFKTPC